MFIVEQRGGLASEATSPYTAFGEIPLRIGIASTDSMALAVISFGKISLDTSAGFITIKSFDLKSL